MAADQVERGYSTTCFVQPVCSLEIGGSYFVVQPVCSLEIGGAYFDVQFSLQLGGCFVDGKLVGTLANVVQSLCGVCCIAGSWLLACIAGFGFRNSCNRV
jgi:hypothetical protein